MHAPEVAKSKTCLGDAPRDEHFVRMHQSMATATTNNYDRVASLYDILSHVYSGGQIRACKAAQLTHIKPTDRVLYAGVGGGEDALEAARLGASVTVVDL